MREVSLPLADHLQCGLFDIRPEQFIGRFLSSGNRVAGRHLA